MRSMVFDEVFAVLSDLPLRTEEQAQLRAWLSAIAHPGECLALIAREAGIPPCPHCRCTHVHRCGYASGLQRFRCCCCGRSYNALTGTPLAPLRSKEKWPADQRFGPGLPTLRSRGRHQPRSGNLRAGIRVRGAIHVQNVNGWHSCFKNWPSRFHGVASRYLMAYSGWQRILDDRRLTTPALLLCAAVRCRQ